MSKEKLTGYGEFWEWTDGNTTPEDRKAYFVVVNSGKIDKATSNTGVIGVTIASPDTDDIIRNTALLIGNKAETDWPTHYLEDDFGNLQTFASNVAGVQGFMDSIGVPLPEANGYDGMTIADVRTDLISVVTTAITQRYQDNYGDPLPGWAEDALTAELASLTDQINLLEPITVPVVNPSYDPEATYTPRSQDPAWSIVVTHGRVVVRGDDTYTVGGYCDVNSSGIATDGSQYLVLQRLSATTIRILL